MSEHDEAGRVSRLYLEGGEDAPDVELDLEWNTVPVGSAEELRTCTGDQAYMIVQGEARMRFGEESVEVGVWDIFHAPAGVSHGFENISDKEELAYVIVSQPPPEQMAR